MKFHVGNRRYFFKLGVFGFIFLMVTPPNPIHSHQSSLSLTPIPTPTLPIPVSPFIPPSPFEIVTTELLKQYNQEQCCYINIKFFFHRKLEARELDKSSLKAPHLRNSGLEKAIAVVNYLAFPVCSEK